MFSVADIVMLAVIGLSGLFAFVRGFVRELFGIGSWIGAAIITFFGYPYSTQLGRELIENRLFAEVAGIGGLFVLSLISFSLIAHVVSDQVRDSMFSGADRALGLAFGLIRGLCVVALVLLGIHFLMDQDKVPAWYKDSYLAPIILKYSEQGLHRASQSYGPGEERGEEKAGKKAGQDADQQDDSQTEQPAGQPAGQDEQGKGQGQGQPGQAGQPFPPGQPSQPSPPTPASPTSASPTSATPSPAAPSLAPANAPNKPANNGATSPSKPSSAPSSGAASPPPGAKTGYGVEERKRLDELFTKKP